MLEENTLVAFIDGVAAANELTGFYLVWRFEAAGAPERQAEALASALQSLLAIGGIEVTDPIRREDAAHYVSFAVGCGAEPAPHDTHIRFSEAERRIDVYCRHLRGSWREVIDHVMLEIAGLFAWTIKHKVNRDC